MKKQIRRLSPHQNGKVAGVLIAFTSLLFLVPFFAMILATSNIDPQGNAAGPPYLFFILFPLMYLVLGYVTVALGCVLYNVLFRYLGGFEFEVTDEGRTAGRTG